MNAIIPGMKLCVSGLPREDGETARRYAVELGAVPTAFRAGADVVVVTDHAGLQDGAGDGEERLAVLTLSALARLATGAQAERRAVEVSGNEVRILDVTLPLGSGTPRLAPPESLFRHICFDRSFLLTARKAALAVKMGIPCMMEGETATSKTTSILWLASICRHEVIRMNLNGHTDTGEIIGRYVPGLSREGQSWAFKEGCIPQALRSGWWVILDEVNLAEPQVLERLNPVLEDPPSLLLTEHDAIRFGTGADVEISGGFHMFGTMNPAEYAGRSVLSPAFRDRWGIWAQLSLPGETELLQMLRSLVTGECPDFVWEGVRWTTPPKAPLYPELETFPDWEETLTAMAVFHARISGASGDEESPASIGRVRRERYVFTRRSLLYALRLLAVMAQGARHLRSAASRVIGEIYIGRLANPADRAAAKTLLRASGLP